MIKLSTLPDNAMLTILPSGSDLRIMDKEEFLQSAYFLDGDAGEAYRVTLADKTTQKPNLWDFVERLGDGETYEDWDLDVYNDIKDQPETQAFMALMKEACDRHPTYWEGEPVEVDMEPPF